MYKKYFKRILDVVLSSIAIVILSPLLFILAILVRINLGTPILFKQNRIGKNEKIFTIYKFRTMIDAFDPNGKVLSDERRFTRFGSILRATSLDELPELFNIVKGDLSIIGPRPLLIEYLPYYSEEERKRHLVRGGLTVPEVLYGKVNPTWAEQLAYESYYAEHVSFSMDVKIIINTFIILWKRMHEDYGNEIRPTLIEERNQILQGKM